MALAIKLDGMLRAGVFHDYTELARLGHVSRARVKRDPRSIAALNHPNICRLYDVGLNYLCNGQPVERTRQAWGRSDSPPPAYRRLHALARRGGL